MIYFVRLPTNTIKIGHTGNVEARMRQLESHYDGAVCLLKVCPGNEADEKLLHQKFSHLRFDRTEQFRPGADLLDHIGEASGLPEAEGVESSQPVSCCRGSKVQAGWRIPKDLMRQVKIEAIEREIPAAQVVAERLEESYRRRPVRDTPQLDHL